MAGRRPGQHAGGPQQREGQAPGPAVVDVDQLVLEQTLVHHGEATRADEASRRERGHPELVRPAFGLESPLDDPEGAFRQRRRRRDGKAEQCAHPMITARVVETGRHPYQPLARAQLDGGRHHDRSRAHPGAGVVVHPLGPAIGPGDRQAAAHRSPLEHLDGDGLGFVDDGVVRRRRPRVGVAVVAFVDQPVQVA